MGKPYQNEIPLYGREYSEELNRISSKPVYIEVFFTKSEIIILIWRLYHAVLLIQKNDPCHKLSYVKETGAKKVEEFENDEIKIL